MLQRNLQRRYSISSFIKNAIRTISPNVENEKSVKVPAAVAEMSKRDNTVAMASKKDNAVAMASKRDNAVAMASKNDNTGAMASTMMENKNTLLYSCLYRIGLKNVNFVLYQFIEMFPDMKAVQETEGGLRLLVRLLYRLNGEDSVLQLVKTLTCEENVCWSWVGHPRMDSLPPFEMNNRLKLTSAMLDEIIAELKYWKQWKSIAKVMDRTKALENELSLVGLASGLKGYKEMGVHAKFKNYWSKHKDTLQKDPRCILTWIEGCLTMKRPSMAMNEANLADENWRKKYAKRKGYGLLMHLYAKDDTMFNVLVNEATSIGYLNHPSKSMILAMMTANEMKGEHQKVLDCYAILQPHARNRSFLLNISAFKAVAAMDNDTTLLKQYGKYLIDSCGNSWNYHQMAIDAFNTANCLEQAVQLYENGCLVGVFNALDRLENSFKVNLHGHSRILGLVCLKAALERLRYLINIDQSGTRSRSFETSYVLGEIKNVKLIVGTGQLRALREYKVLQKFMIQAMGDHFVPPLETCEQKKDKNNQGIIIIDRNSIIEYLKATTPTS